MDDWSRVEASLEDHIEIVRESLPPQAKGYTDPSWDAAQIAEEAIREARALLADGAVDTDPGPGILATKLAYKKMACGLDWAAIRAHVCADIGRCALPQWVKDQADDFVDGAWEKVIEKWNPLADPDLARPGHALAAKIAREMARQEAKKKKKRAPGRANQKAPSILAQLPAPQPRPMHQQYGLNGARLAKAIDKFLYSNYPWRTVVAWMLDEIYDVDKKLCGVIASDRPRKKLRDYEMFWHRTFAAIEKKLAQYLREHPKAYMD